jgi:hypothetical protein
MHEIDEMLQLQLIGQHEKARVLSDKLEKMGSNGILDPSGKNTDDIWFRHCFNRGWFKLQEGEYQEGCQLLEYGRFLQVYGSPPLKTSKPMFNPEVHNIQDKTIIISLEGGLGDEIIHARFAQSFKKLGARSVILAAAPELVSVFQRIEDVDQVILRNQADEVDHDFWIPGFSAGWVSGNTYDTLPNGPYLSATSSSQDIWSKLINSDRIRVGIRWAGNPKFEHQQLRRFPENFLINLSKYKELQLYSLQKDYNLTALPESIIDLQDLLISWEDTAAAITNLDLVITSCTSVAHLSAAMGKETWVITPLLPYHTWTLNSPHSTTSPYYQTVKIFRQNISGKWNDCFQNLYAKLEDQFNLESIELPDCDPVYQKLNLGCGFNKLPGFVNVDKLSFSNPDQIVDLEQFPWPWPDNSFDHIVAQDILEHLGNTSSDFINVIKEMYRVSCNAAIWEIQVPHWRSDIAIDDPTHKRLITTNTFMLFDKQHIFDKIREGHSESPLAFEHDLDLLVCGSTFQYAPLWQEKIEKNQISDEELEFALNTYNNVALTTRMLIQVHKPGRFNLQELQDMINDKSRS